jgi:hypothetical protein
MFDYSGEVVDKNIKQKRTKSRPLCTLDNTEKGDENFPKMRMK